MHVVKIQQTKMLVTCQMFCDLFLFGLARGPAGLAVFFSSDKM